MSWLILHEDSKCEGKGLLVLNPTFGKNASYSWPHETQKCRNLEHKHQNTLFVGDNDLKRFTVDFRVVSKALSLRMHYCKQTAEQNINKLLLTAFMVFSWWFLVTIWIITDCLQCRSQSFYNLICILSKKFFTFFPYLFCNLSMQTCW